MTDYLTEQEQVEMLKNWIKQYSAVILTSVLITMAIIFGWRYWQQRQDNTLAHASNVYDEMLTMRARNDASATLVQADKLYTHYTKTSYGTMAAFMTAREAIVQKDYPKAEQQLNLILDKSNVDSFRQIARIRLARVLLAEQKPEEALKTLDKVDDESFNGLTDEVKGDAYFAMKNVEMARQTYQKALAELPNADSVRPLLQMKYDNLVTN